MEIGPGGQTGGVMRRTLVDGGGLTSVVHAGVYVKG